MPTDIENSELPKASRLRFSLRDLLFSLTIVGLLVAYWSTYQRLRNSESELQNLRRETGYLPQTAADKICAVRAPSDQPLTYRLRVRVPEKGRFRVAYSSIWKKSEPAPDWYSAIEVPSGESILTARIMKDPRDDRWKIATLVQSALGTKRMATTLPQEHAEIFRGSHDVISTGVGKQMVSSDQTESIRLLDEKWLVGENGLMLYGDRPPDGDQIGVFAELQPDNGPL